MDFAEGLHAAHVTTDERGNVLDDRADVSALSRPLCGPWIAEPSGPGCPARKKMDSREPFGQGPAITGR
ncbi:hypothetical protein A7982_13108 [Minicystis rosea]|nr:hypothetical protein A7982_13108 [Minicystis rosea]